MAINSYLALKNCEYSTATTGNSSLPKNSTQEQEYCSDMEVQRNTENVVNLNVDSIYKLYLCMCVFGFILSFLSFEKKMSTAHSALK